MLEPAFFHVDLDAFYASVEQLDNPAFRGKPVVIGAQPGHRGVVSACSYEARKFGIHSAMPISQAYRLCKDAIYLPVRMKRYQELSGAVMEIFNAYTPIVQQISIDEAFLDMKGTEKLLGRREQVALNLKNRIKTEIGLTISIGIAPNCYLAKLASNYDKPDGLFQVKEGKEIEFLDCLQLKDLWGIGKKTLLQMEDLNIDSIPKLRDIPLTALKRMFGKAGGNYLYKITRGIDPGIFLSQPKSHSISNEVTFESDTKDLETIEKTLLDLSHNIMFRLLESEYRAKTVFLKIRYQDFSTVSIQKTIDHHLSSAEELYRIALELLFKKWHREGQLRLLGLGLSSLEGHKQPDQMELFDTEYQKKKKVEKAVYNIRKKMSENAILKARLMKGKGTDKKEI